MERGSGELLYSILSTVTGNVGEPIRFEVCNNCISSLMCDVRMERARLGYTKLHGCFGLETKVLKRIYGIAHSKQTINDSLSLPLCDIRFENSF